MSCVSGLLASLQDAGVAGTQGVVAEGGLVSGLKSRQSCELSLWGAPSRPS